MVLVLLICEAQLQSDMVSSSTVCLVFPLLSDGSGLVCGSSL